MNGEALLEQIRQEIVESEITPTDLRIVLNILHRHESEARALGDGRTNTAD